MEQLSYNLKQLCQAAQVTERTVRFYIKEGLLAPPTGPKSVSRYGYAHLLRLQLIRQLKARYLPLREIRNLMEGKGLAELEGLAQSLGLFEENTEEEKQMEKTKSPLVEKRQPGFRLASFQPGLPLAAPHSWAGLSGLPSAALNTNPVNLGQQVFFPKQPMPPRPAVQPPIIPSIYDPVEEEEPRSNVWERLSVMPGVELHVESGLANENREVLEGLLREIRRRLKKR